jgi:hypothetical protein
MGHCGLRYDSQEMPVYKSSTFRPQSVASSKDAILQPERSLVLHAGRYVFRNMGLVMVTQSSCDELVQTRTTYSRSVSILPRVRQPSR